MFVNNKTRRFTLYHLEQNEIYIRDFAGYCTYIDLNNNQTKVKEKGRFYICSKTIIFQADLQTIPIMKYKFQSMKSQPKNTLQQTNSSNKSPQKTTEYIYFLIKRIISIKCSLSNPPQPFKFIEDINHKIYIYPSYENPTKLIEWFTVLFGYSKQKNVYDLQEKIYELIIKKDNKTGFNMTLVESVLQKPIHQDTNLFVRRILPLNQVYGYMFITDMKVYFQPFHNISGKSVHKIQVKEIAKLFKRRYELKDIGLQIITSKGKSYYFAFQNISNRNRIYVALGKKVSQKCIKQQSLQKITYLWQTKQISNYDYLMHLNQTGNRSFSDLSQYPVFPWVLSNFVDETIDLQDVKNYRDLSKPIGALNQDRLRAFLQRYQDMPSPKFMYGSHYSAPGYVIGYLVRKKPEYMLKLQSGKFDKPDRLFKSIKGDWKNVMNNPTSLKQLIPQFYQNDPSFLLNQLSLDLGVRQNKKRVGDVKLPKWAKGDPNKFLEIQRNALESEYVSNNLHLWIDLIFGAKQRGPEAIKAYNVFNYMTYQGMIDVEAIKDPIEKIGVKCQINEFGQCPKQIFKISHPPRGSLIILQNIPPQIQLKKEQSEKFLSPKENIKNLQPSSLYSSTGKPKIKTVLSQGKYSDIKLQQISKAHKANVTKILNLPSKPNTIVTIGQDGFLKVFDVVEKSCLKSFKISDSCLSSIVPIKGDEIFATGSWDNCIYIFNIVYGSKSKPIVAHDNSISDLLYLNKKKRLVSSSWDCSIKFWRVVGNNLDNSQIFKDHDNQITTIAVNRDQTMLAFGDIEGNIISMNITEKQKIFEINLNNQKISTLNYLNNNLIASGEIQIRLIDTSGIQLTSFIVQKNNGMLTNVKLDEQHLYIATSKKHLGLFDILQQKKTGYYFNDYRVSEQDKLPAQKQLCSIGTVNDSTIIIVGTSTGSLLILRN